jgi:hypothetical protein
VGGTGGHEDEDKDKDKDTGDVMIPTRRTLWGSGAALAALVVLALSPLRAAPPEDTPRGPPESHPVSSGRAHLDPTEEACAVPGSDGVARLLENPAHAIIHVLVKHLAEGQVLDVVFCDEGGAQETVGMITTRPEDEEGDDAGGGDDGGGAGDAGDGEGDDEDGANGILKLDTGRGDALPLGAMTVSDLFGATVKIRDADGCTLLSGVIAPHPSRGGPPDDGGDDGGGDDGGGDDGGGGDGAVTAALVLSGPHDASFIRGDADMDGAVAITDPILTLNVLFQGAPFSYCRDALDANDDGGIDVSDPVASLGALFLGTGPLPPPSVHDGPGFDPTADLQFCYE